MPSCARIAAISNLALFPHPSPPWYNPSMRFTSDTLEGFQRAGLSIAARVLVRDDLHLGPLLLTAAVAARLRSGLRALEAYVRRLLILLALKMEPDLKPDNRPCVIRMAQGKRATESKSFPLFSGENAFPDSLFSAPDPWAERPAKTAAPIYAAPLLERLKILKDLLEAPQARAPPQIRVL
ncbi:MAG: hypothetical protein AAGF20_01210 [Pseudomonadota bacterium]